MASGSINSPAISANPKARVLALAWSSASRSTISVSATMPAAAMMPACRIPPPTDLRILLARVMKASSPQTTDPTGAASPLLRQKVTESAGAARSASYSVGRDCIPPICRNGDSNERAGNCRAWPQRSADARARTHR